MALPNECIELRAMELAVSFPEGSLIILQQRKPRVVFLFAQKDYQIAMRCIKGFLMFGWNARPSAWRRAPSHKHGLDTGLPPSKFSGFSTSTGFGNTVFGRCTFTLA